MRSFMVQGCGSDVGKSVLVAGLCRLFANRGIVVRPFKPQNMSNNAAVTSDGGEIGRSTALQAMACRTPATVDMNPVLLKPQSDTSAQLIIRGRRAGALEAQAHQHSKSGLLGIALECYARLQRDSELIIVEGAGSPAETNLRAHDLANMGFAHAADLSVVLVGDIDRGHVIASLVGAHAVLDAADRDRVKGFIINKFRGNISLFSEGMKTITSHTNWQGLGVVPWLAAARGLPAEDGMQLDRFVAPRTASAEATSNRRVKIAVLRFPHIANFDDFDPLQFETEVDLTFVQPGTNLPLDADLIVLPGSKATIADLQFLRAQRWDEDLRAYARRGGRILGVCAGYQMLGKVVRDPYRVEGEHEVCAGIGLLDLETTITHHKVLRTVRAVNSVTGAIAHGYEMHMGVSTGPATTSPMFRFEDGTIDGAQSGDGRIAGCYIHGLFSDAEFRSAFLATFGVRSSREDFAARIDGALDEIAMTLERCLRLDLLAQLL